MGYVPMVNIQVIWEKHKTVCVGANTKIKGKHARLFT
jgi:hypothetical protein